MQAAKGGKQSVFLPRCHTWEPQQWPARQNTHIDAGTHLNKTRRKKRKTLKETANRRLQISMINIFRRTN